MNSRTKPLTRAGIFLGVGLGGFVDGILFHQILQFHNMTTGRIPKDTIARVEVNMFWDGIFHAFTWVMTFIGVVLLFRAGLSRQVRWSGKALTGSMFLGWGLFNLVEGVIDHHILHLHHVVEVLGPSIFDWLFLLAGGVFLLGGWWTVRSVARSSYPRS
ncbi:DUF2243 domain-containing protein [Haloferula sargassicola]|uniref:DUF2243 domain-containing protein n=1 Tax=Haloferula sargassicola TaxID=490096 RepID=A0ABP9UNF9_9BACT